MFNEFGDIGTNKTLEFYIIRFHNSFDGLIGNDILRPLNACIDYRKKEITIGNKTLPMHFDNETLNRKKIIAPHDSDLVYYKEYYKRRNFKCRKWRSRNKLTI